MSCDFTSSGYKCLFVVYALFLWEASCYKSCFLSHDVSIYCMMELQTSLHVSILHPRHHSSWTGLPFLLGGWKVLHQWCHCTRHIILYFELVQGLLSFSHMILPVICLNSHWLQMSLRSLCLVSHDVSIYYMMELQTSLHISILHPRHHSSWTGLPFILVYFFIAWRFCINDVAAFIILFFILNYCHLFYGTSLILLLL